MAYSIQMNTTARSKKEWLKDQLDRMDSSEHTQVFNMIKQHTDQFTKTQSGVLISTDQLNDECLSDIEKYITFRNDQKKQMEEDVKTRKNYERLVRD